MVHRDTNRRYGGVAIVPQSIANAATVNGETISEPGRKGRTLIFRLIGGNMRAAQAATVEMDTDNPPTVVVQGRVGSGAWGNLLDNNGDPLGFTLNETVETGSGTGTNWKLHNSSIKGTLLIDRLPYDDYRLVVANPSGNAILVSASYEIGDLQDSDTHVQRDHLLYKHTPYTEGAPVASDD